MPIYEYRCEACGRMHEALQKVSDSPLKSCPVCKKRRLKRLMSAPRFRLKGAGWYETDFKSDGEKKRNLAESGGDADKSASADSAGGKESPKDGAKDSAKDAAKDGAKDGAKDSTTKDSGKDSSSGGHKSAAKASSKPVGRAKAATPRKKANRSRRR